MNVNYSIQSGGVELLDQIHPLWVKLRDHHIEMAGVLAGGIVDADFQERKAELRKNEARLLIELVTVDGREDLVGYCISTINKKMIGEIDSIYVDEHLRNSGLGRQLVQRSLDWMDTHGISRRRVHVMVMNDSARRLYEGFGFVPRQLEMVHFSGLANKTVQEA
jgi:ribosomal protein S18 acetylase RimI-like enzyme